MGLLKHKRTRDTIAAEPTPRSSEGSVIARSEYRNASGTTNTNNPPAKQYPRAASAKPPGSTRNRTKVLSDVGNPADPTTSSTRENLDPHDKRASSRGGSEFNESHCHGSARSPASEHHHSNSEDLICSSRHERISCARGNMDTKALDRNHEDGCCMGRRPPSGNLLSAAKDATISTHQPHGKEEPVSCHVDLNNCEEPENKNSDVRRRPKMSEARNVGRTSVRRKAEIRVSRNEQTDRRNPFYSRRLDNDDTLCSKRRVTGLSSEKEYQDRDDVWCRAKAKRTVCHGGSKAAFRNARDDQTTREKIEPSTYCLTDPRFMPVSAVEKLFPGKLLSAVQARDPQTAAAVRAARADRVVRAQSVQDRKNSSRRCSTSSRVSETGCPKMPMRKVKGKKQSERGRPTMMDNSLYGRINGNRKSPVKIRPRSAPLMRNTRGPVAEDDGCHHTGAHMVEHGNRVTRDSSETAGRVSSRVGTRSWSSSARTSGTEISDGTRSSSACSLSTIRASSR